MEDNKLIVTEQTNEITLINDPIKLSYSGLSTYINCPFAYYLRYNKKIKYDLPNISLIFGRATHVLIQEWLTAIYNKSEKEGLKIKFKERFLELIKQELQMEKDKYGDITPYFTKEIVNEYYQDYLEGLYYLRNKRSSYFKLKGMQLVGIEHELKFEYEHNNKKIIFIGFIDVILKNKNTGQYYIIDIKTSKSGWRPEYEKKDPVKRAQVLFYKHFYSSQFNIDQDKIKVYFLIIKRKPFVSDEFTTKYIQEFVPPQSNITVNKSLKYLDTFIDNVLFDDPYFPKNADGCRFCVYKETEHCNKSERIPLIEIQKEYIKKLETKKQLSNKKLSKVEVK